MYVLILSLLTACASSPEFTISHGGGSASVPASFTLDTRLIETPVLRPPLEMLGPQTRSRWVAVDWNHLPGWSSDRVFEFWPALLQSCEKPLPAWRVVCVAAKSLPPQDNEQAHQWLQQHLQVFRIESPEGVSEGLITGYFEPLLEARRISDQRFNVPLFALPSDISLRQPYWSRQQIDSLPVARDSLRNREIAYVADPLDALILQIQGSGRLKLTEADGSEHFVRLAFAGHNNHPYQSVGRWLIEQGELMPGQASWPAIKSWAQRNPARVQDMLWANPRVIFFREEALADPRIGPKGAQAVPLTPGRSIAVDPRSIPYGTPVWLDTTEPLSHTPLRRLVMAQDTGAAITGAVRADYFWGWGEEAEQQAGRMKQALRLWALWPRPPMAQPQTEVSGAIPAH
ncbi:MAG: murein transglycosylase A [Burkholderiales bacterium]